MKELYKINLQVINKIFFIAILYSISFAWAIPENDTDFSVIMSADTQYGRTIDPDDPGAERPFNEQFCSTNDDPTSKQCRERSEQNIQAYFNSMAALKKSPEGKDIAGVFINGDLTEYGHTSELDEFTSLLKNGVSAMAAATTEAGKLYSDVASPVGFFMGLGNHDYANNVNDCFDNECAINMVWFMQKMNWPGIITSEIVNKDGKSTAEGTSLAYSVDIQNVHFVVLNNYPTYANSWRGTGGNQYIILSSLNWLALDLDKARKANKFIVIAFHDPSEHFALDNNARRFKRLIESNKVSAIFVGHFHWANGENTGVNKEIYGDIPVIQSGSGIYGEYSLVKFDTINKKMFVSVYDSANGQAKPVAPYYPLKASYDLKQ